MDTDENDYPANTSTPGAIAIGARDYGVINSIDDSDWFKVSLSGGQQYRFTIEAGTTNGLFDPQLAIYSFAGSLLVQATYGQGFQSKYVEFTPTATADYFLSASGPPLMGTYIITTENLNSGGSTDNNMLTGTSGNDTLSCTSGNDTLDGGAGIDKANYTGNRANFTLTQSGASFITTDSTGAQGTDMLTNMERLNFADMSIALDVAGGNAGTTAKILGAVFGPASVSNREYVGIGLSMLDSGMNYSDLMLLALNARLGAGFSNVDEVNLLYQNLVGVLPSIADLNYFVETINSGQFTQSSLAIMAADLDLNATNINLTGLAQTGIEFTG